MKKVALFVLLSVFSIVANGGDTKVSELAVPAERIGPDWTGPTGLVIDDIESPPTADKEMAEIIAGLKTQMKPLGVKGTADFTYSRKGDAIQQVTVRVFLFNSEEQCKSWIKTKYEFPGWEKKYKRVEEKNLVCLDSLEMNKRIVSIGRLWITAGTIGDNDDHLRVLSLFLDRIKKRQTEAEPTARADRKPAPQP
jgi:hypothetical protein